MFKRFLTVSFFFLLFILFLNPLMAAEWKMIKYSAGIKLYERPVEGTDLMEYLGVGSINARMEVLVEILRDVSTWKDWVADCKGTQLLKQLTLDDLIVYLVLEPPVIDDRDVIIKDKGTYDYEGGKGIVDFIASTEASVPPQDARIRVKTLHGIFEMEFIGRDRTKFYYYLKCDPAGDIAKSVAYAVMKNYPYDTIANLRKLVGDKSFADRARGGEIEKKIDAVNTNEGHVRRIFTARMARLVKNKAALTGIMAQDKENFKAIVDSKSAYPAFEKAAESFFAQYLDKVMGAGTGDKLKGSKNFRNELIDLICTDSQARTITFDDIAVKYK